VCDPHGKEMLGIISIDDVVRLIASERRCAVELPSTRLDENR